MTHTIKMNKKERKKELRTEVLETKTDSTVIYLLPVLAAQLASTLHFAFPLRTKYQMHEMFFLCRFLFLFLSFIFIYFIQLFLWILIRSHGMACTPVHTHIHTHTNIKMYICQERNFICALSVYSYLFSSIFFPHDKQNKQTFAHSRTPGFCRFRLCNACSFSGNFVSNIIIIIIITNDGYDNNSMGPCKCTNHNFCEPVTHAASRVACVGSLQKCCCGFLTCLLLVVVLLVEYA
ncbi:unnamed protein product [Ceratitis capitata]|uniref:(Mediterranean fruit fly) hypothetical protein n=1 Tax=Ceratitis capitata TaxID=7213 RepID=A0A811UY88_CERCA|nr:unnamed protein product [Ceratitis capitata]